MRRPQRMYQPRPRRSNHATNLPRLYRKLAAQKRRNAALRALDEKFPILF